jgi:hypothetical protein
VRNYLARYFDTHLIVLEADVIERADKSLAGSGYRHFFEKDDNTTLHWTKYINRLITNYVNTPFVALYDIDVVIPVPQMLKAMHSLRYENEKAVSPYDGRFFLVDNAVKALFGQSLDCSLLIDNERSFRVHTKRSYGGTILFNTDVFRTAGMENEYFDSWGVIDYERIKRMQVLGYTVRRIEGGLFHLHHARGSNSTFHSSESRLRFYTEYLKICSMERDELEGYVATWPWISKYNQHESGK